MIWEKLVGHDSQKESFQKRVARGNLASTFLFVGLEGIGKRMFAEGLAEALLCHNSNPKVLAACGKCPGCVQVQTGNHPDLLQVQRPAEKNVLPIELFVGDREHRSDEGLCRDIRMKPSRAGSRKIAIIDDADYLNQESGNALLKTLEEPPDRSIIILIGTSSHRQLRTILSRCQIVRFDALSVIQVEQILDRHPEWESEVDRHELAMAAAGSISTARLLMDPLYFRFRGEWLEQLASGDPGSDDFASSMVKFAEEGLKDSASKRERYYFLADRGIEFLAQLMNRVAGGEVQGDRVLRETVETALPIWSGGSTGMADAIDALCEFQFQIEANAQAPNAIDFLCSEIRRCSRGHSRLLNTI